MTPLTRTTPMHGRHHELLLVRHLLRAARSGDGAALLATGSPGTGRTTLLERAAADADGLTVLRTRAAPAERHLPAAGLNQLLHPLLHHLPRLPARPRATLVRALDSGDPGQAGSVAAAVHGLLAAAAARTPLFVCVDDFHLLDPLSMEAVAFAARRLPADGAAALLTSLHEHPDHLAGVPVHALRPLSHTDLLRTLEETPGLSGTARNDLARAAQGNPGAALELAAGARAAEAGDVHTAPLWAPPPAEGERTEAYAETIARLPAPARRALLETAADPVHGPGSTDALTPARRAGLVTDEHGRPVPAHPLARAAAYHRADPEDRRSAHRSLAARAHASGDLDTALLHRAATAPGPDEGIAAELAASALRAARTRGHAHSSVLHQQAAALTSDPFTRAVRSVEAARAAWTSGDPERAHRLLDRGHAAPEHADLLRAEMELRSGVAIDAFHLLDATVTRIADRDPQAALQGLFHAGEASCLSGDHARFFATAERAGRWRGGEGVRHPRDLLHLDYMAGKAALFRGRHREGVATLRGVLDRADAAGDPQSLVLGAIAGLLCGDQQRTRSLATRAATRARSTGALALVPQALEFRTYAELWSGRLAQAEATAVDGLAMATASGQRNCAGHHRGALALVAAVRGEEDVCRTHAGSALAVAAENDVGLPAGLAAWALCLLDLGAGRTAEAALGLRALAHAGPGRGHAAVRLLMTPHLVEAAVRGGVPVRVDAGLATFEAWAGATGDATAHALVMRCRGLLAPGREADAWFERALELHASGYCDLDEARTRLLYGGHLRRTRRPGRAREHLYTALSSLEHLGAVPWARQAAEELRAARGTTGPSPAVDLDRLSPQQARVARHVVSGATNREVAARLHLSPRTVDHHLRNIYAELGVRSRVELARLVSPAD